MSARLVVLEGLDGSGKGTQTAILRQRFLSDGVKAEYVSFPDYENEGSSPVKMYLSGKLGEISEVNAYAASMLYAVDRYTSFRASWKGLLEDNALILCDRYTTSNITHQMSKLPNTQWDGFLDWIYNLEYDKIGLPRPSIVLYLDVEPNVSKRLIHERYGGDEELLDIHEKNYEYLLHCRTAALYAAQRLGWVVVSCATSNGSIRDREEIADELISYIRQEIEL